MTSTTENRIWRGLFLAAIVGCGIAATSGEKAPAFVAGWKGAMPEHSFLLDESGRVVLMEFHEPGMKRHEGSASYTVLDLKPSEE